MKKVLILRKIMRKINKNYKTQKGKKKSREGD
jgi:hypothetical protein